MDKESLRQKFIVGEEVLRERIEKLVDKTLPYCVVAQNGTVHLQTQRLPAKNQIKLVLAARILAAQLVDNISAEVSVQDIAASTGLPENQIRARANDLVKEHFAATPKKGTFIANVHKVEPFLDSLPR